MLWIYVLSIFLGGSWFTSVGYSFPSNKAKLNISNSKCTGTDTEKKTKPKTNYILLWRQWHSGDIISVSSQNVDSSADILCVCVKIKIFFLFPHRRENSSSSIIRSGCSTLYCSIFHQRQITNTTATFWCSPRLLLSSEAQPFSPDKRLVALGLSLKEHQQGADQTSAALVFRSSTHLRSRSSSCEHRAGNSLHIPSLGLHQAQLGSTHRGNCKMQIKGTTALTAFHWARPC